MKGKQQSSQVISKGSVLIKARPFVYVLKSRLQGERCDYCFQSTNLFRCSGCRFVHYCGKNCQKLGWRDHSSECAGFKKVAPRVVPDAARLLGRIIVKLKRGGDKERGAITATKFRVFKDLMSHYSDLKEDKLRREHFESLVAVLSEYLGPETLNQAALLGTYGRMVVNSFSILDGEMSTSLGTGIYLGPSVVDHSCAPNAVATFEGLVLVLRALQEIPTPIDWTKVWISYIELLNSTADRRRELQENYFFLCHCSRCSDIEDRDSKTLRALRCPSTTCQAPVPVPLEGPSRQEGIACPSCSARVDRVTVTEYLEEMQISYQELEKMKDIAYLDVARQCLQRQDRIGFHDLDMVHARTLDTAFESAIQRQQWEEAEQYGKRLLPAFRLYYGRGHPLAGLLHLKLAKLQNLLNLEFRQNLKDAEEILRVTHGPESVLYREQLLPLLMQQRNGFNH